MPNNPARNKRGFVKVANGIAKARRRDVITALRVTNRVFATSSQELGSPNGGPAPVNGGNTSTGGSTGSGSALGGGFSGSDGGSIFSGGSMGGSLLA